MKTAALLLTALLTSASPVFADSSAYQQTVLPNGMKIVTKEDHSVPLVAVLISIRAGAIEETHDTSGMSHLLEHLVFDGAKDLTREKIKETFDSTGGYVNAYTREEHMGHEIVMPTEYFRTGVRAQADMLLRSVVPAQELAKEKKVVIEEIGSSKAYPSSVVADTFDSKLYAGTPLAWPVLGTEDSVKTATRDGILDFYHSHYYPGNMTAFVIGDITHEQAVKELRSVYSGNERREPTVYPSAKPDLSGKRLVVGARVPSSYLEIAVDAPLPSSPDAGAFQVLTRILGGGDDSRLYKRLVLTRKPIARYVSADYRPHHDHALLRISVMLRDPSFAGQAFAAVMDEMSGLAAKEIPESEITRAKTGYRADAVFGSERLVYLARELAAWQSVGDYGYRDRLQREAQDASPAQTLAVAKRYFKKPEYLAALIGPEKAVRGMKLEPSSEPPAAPNSPTLEPPAPKANEPAKETRSLKKVLPNGLVIVARENPYADIISMNVLIKNRSALEPQNLPGISEFDSMMLDEGAGGRTASQIGDLLAATGARLQLVDNPFFGFDDYYLSKNYSYMRLESLSEFFDTDLALVADMVTSPSYPADRMEAVRSEILARFKDAENNSYSQARRAFFKSLFPDYHYGTPIIGTRESIQKVTKDDLEAYHHLAYAPNNMIVTVVGNRPAELMLKSIAAAFGDMAKADLPTPEPAPVEHLKKPVVLERKVKAQQAAIYLGNALPVMDPSHLPAIDLVNEILTNRLNSQVREKLGLAYSVGSEAEISPLGGWFYVAMGTRPENVDKAKAAILKELNRLRDEPVSQEELDTAKSSIWGRRLRYRQSRVNQAYFLSYAEYLALGYRFDDQFVSKLKKLTPSDVQSTARKIIDVPGYTVSTAGG